ncbi:MAG TPA: hypothetical protein PLK67_06460 [Bryobacteraceae bacterium]|nr:hypothetical protein [Bryobacteraceae bacterium]
MRTAVFIVWLLTAALVVPSAGQEAGGPPSMSFDEALAKLATYEVGHDRAALISLQAIVYRESASPEKRKTMETAFIKFLESNATRAGKDQVCRHLMLIGSTASVPVLTKMLGSEETADMARYALERIPGAAVDKALRSMLPKTKGRVQVGIINTLGQRKGIGLGGSRDGSGEPWYVARKDLEHNALYAVQGHDHPWLMSRGLVADSAHWIAGAPPVDDGRLAAKTRYRQTDSPCRLTGASGGRFTLGFDAPQWAVTPGQSAVLYRGEVCLGGGIILSSNA